MLTSLRAIALLLVWSAPALAQGPLIVVGGGTTVPEITARTLELAGGKRAVVAMGGGPALEGHDATASSSCAP